MEMSSGSGKIISLAAGILLLALLTACSDSPGNPSKEADITFRLAGENFRFTLDGREAPALTVSQGDRVRIEFTSSEGVHNWMLDEFNAETASVGAGNSASVEFVASEKGSYEYYCGIGRHREFGMVGEFIVE